MKYCIFILSIFFTLSVWSQLPRKTNNLIGTWEFKNGSGFEVWSKEGIRLIGYEYRLNKIGDSIKVAEMMLEKVNKVLLYTFITNLTTPDIDSQKKKVIFVGGKRKMKFYNRLSSIPYRIDYVFSFFSHEKLKIRMYYGQDDKPVKLILKKVN